jgi:hypothetical protein
MPITPTNQSKNSVNPTGSVKYGVWLWGDILATWGDAIATWGGLPLVMVNQNKSALASYLELQDGTALLLQDGTNLELQGGAGALVYINQSKS